MPEEKGHRIPDLEVHLTGEETWMIWTKVGVNKAFPVRMPSSAIVADLFGTIHAGFKNTLAGYDVNDLVVRVPPPDPKEDLATAKTWKLLEDPMAKLTEVLECDKDGSYRVYVDIVAMEEARSKSKKKIFKRWIQTHVVRSLSSNTRPQASNCIQAD